MEGLTQARTECGGSTTGVLLRWADASEPSPSSPPGPVQKEHMFEKVVTPSDVGKLNRLVIPKQHAERYFPLDSAAHDKGLLLNFEDRHGKPWRFRYSYWNSSQSYVMTKGWSRFVKEKRLDAGDTVLFGRGVGDDARDRLFIDWKRRPDPPAPFRIPHRHPFYLSAAATRLFAPPGPPNSYIYFSSPQPVPQPVVLDSFPLAHGKAVAPGGPKRVRLFGVNLDEPCERFPSPDLRLGSLAPTSSSFSSSTQGGKNGAIIDLLPLDL